MTFDLAFIFGLIASCLIVGMTFLKTQKSITWTTIALSVSTGIQYLLLDQTTAAYLNVVTIAVGFLTLLSLTDRSFLSTTLSSNYFKFALLIIYTLSFGLLNGGFSLDLQLLVYFGSILMVSVMMVDNIWATKAILFIAGICWTVFQLQTGAWGNLFGQVFYFGGLFWSSYRLVAGKMSTKKDAIFILDKKELITS